MAAALSLFSLSLSLFLKDTFPNGYFQMEILLNENQGGHDFENQKKKNQNVCVFSVLK